MVLRWKYHENFINTMAADALVPCVARTSTAMVLIMIQIQIQKYLFRFKATGPLQTEFLN